MPFDVSESTLRRAAAELSVRYPGLHVHGVVGDFTLHLGHLPTDGVPLVAFLGSTIGNLYVEERRAFLAMLAEHLPTPGWLLLGVDLVKPIERLVAAYDDPLGVTAAFTRNVLAVLNRELDASFDVDAFDHIAFWDPLRRADGPAAAGQRRSARRRPRCRRATSTCATARRSGSRSPPSSGSRP